MILIDFLHLARVTVQACADVQDRVARLRPSEKNPGNHGKISKTSQATGDVANQRPIQPNLRHGSRGGSGTTGLTPEALRRQNHLAFLQQELAEEVLANIVPPILDPEVSVDILHQSLLGSDDLGSVVSPSVATAHEGPRPQRALVVVGDLRDNMEDRVQELQRFIVAERVQGENAEALRIRLEAQLEEALEFIETHGHHNQTVKEAKSLASIEEVVCRTAPCESACRNAQGQMPVWHLR